MRRISCLLIFLFSNAALCAQLPAGLWISSHQLRVGTYLETEGMEEHIAKMMKNILAEDSVYTEGGLVLEIDSLGGARLLRDIRSEFIVGQFALERNELIFGYDTFCLKLPSSSKLLLIRQFTDSIRQENHFHRLPESQLDKDNLNVPLPLPGAHLQLNVADTLNRVYQLDVINERRVVITGTNGEKPFTTGGTWYSRWVGNTLLFSFFDNHFDQMQLYTFYGDSVHALVGSTFNNAEELSTAPPKLLASLRQSQLPDSSKIESLRDEIIGSWAAINDPLFYDPAIEFGFLSYQSFEITFSADSSFALTKSGTVLKHGDSIPLEEVTKGKWELSPTGNYLILKPPDDIPFYFSIAKAGPQELDVYYFMKTLSEFPSYNVFENRRVELRR